jgi:hypothetical protein
MMNTLNRLLGFVPVAALAFGLAACQDSAPTAPISGADTDTETDALTSVLRNQTLTQVDRMGFPAINTAVVIDDATQNVYNTLTPSDDPGLIPFAASQLETFYGVPADGTSEAVAGLFLPDILPVVNHPVYPGRRPADDVIDTLLGALFGPSGVSALAPFPPLASDNVDSNNVAFPTTFPYLAGPNGG